MQVPLLGTRRAHLGQALPQLQFSQPSPATKQGKQGPHTQQRQLAPRHPSPTALICHVEADTEEGGKISKQDRNEQRQHLVGAVKDLVYCLVGVGARGGAVVVWGTAWREL